MKGNQTIELDTDERAVSPVIGVILMVAITVILAAVIGTFVLNLGGSVKSQVQAGANVNVDSNTVRVTYSSNQNADHLDVDITCDTAGSSLSSTMSNVGDSLSQACPSGDSEADVTITAVGDDGTRTVITDKTVDLG